MKVNNIPILERNEHNAIVIIVFQSASASLLMVLISFF
jgi:hypothetical protein